MTINDMHIAFREYLDRSGAQEMADFGHDQIDFWINQYIHQFVKDRSYGQKGFEQNEKRVSDIEQLVVAVTIPCSSVGAIKPNGYMALLPTDHWFTVGEEVDYDYTDCHGVSKNKRKGVRQCTEDEYVPIVSNPFSPHVLEFGSAKPLRLRYEDHVELISDGSYVIKNYYLVYIRKPITVLWDTIVANRVDCDLKELTHDEIVRGAVKMALASIGDSEKWQIQTAEDSKKVV